MWKFLFNLTFVYAVVDGFISNYFYPAKAPYLFKDFIVLAALFFFFISEHAGRWTSLLRQRMGSSAWMSAMFFLFIGFAQMFNPASPGLLLGILGFKVVYLYWVLALLAFTYFGTYKRTIGFMKMIFYLAIPVNLFGVAQFIIGPPLMYMIFGAKAHVKIDIAAVGDFSLEESFFRVIGTFASSGQYGNFLVINSIFGLILIFSKLIDHRQKIFIIAMMLLNFSVQLMSGSRSSFVFLIATLLIFFSLCRQARSSFLNILVVGLLLFGAFQLLGSKVMTRYQSLGQIGMVKERTAQVTVKQFLEIFETYPMGKGIGSASTAAVHLSKYEASTYGLIENYPSKLQKEMGIMGVVAFYLFIFLLLGRWFDVWLREIPEGAEVPALMIFSYICSQFLIQAVFFIVDIPPVSLYIWMLVGIAARIYSWTDAMDEPEILSRTRVRYGLS